MSFIDRYLRRHAVGARVVPFAVFVILTTLQGQVPSPGQYWLYLAKLVFGGWLMWLAREALTELQWKLSGPAVLAGVGVFILWVGLDPLFQQLGFPNSYPKLRSSGPEWNPPATFGEGSPLAWTFIAIRILGASLIVPMLEEVFYRSFLYRYMEKPDFLSVPLKHFALRSFLITAAVFGGTHHEWLAGILTGFAYQALVCWKGRLGDAVTAHAITNLLLGFWVVWKKAWHFW